MAVRVRVRFFASHRERAGTGRDDLDLPDEATVEDLLQRVLAAYPNLAPLIGSARVAVNQEYAPTTTVLREGDEVAIIPPVAGGGRGW